MLHALLQTDSSLVPLVLRLTLAIVMFPHGAQKALGWFGGHGLSGTAQLAVGSMVAVAAMFAGGIATALAQLRRT